MEDPTIPELLLEVTTIEDIAASSDKEDARMLEAVAGGFRNLVADPRRYGVHYGDYRHWINTFEEKFNAAEEESRNNPNSDIVEALSDVLALSDVGNKVPLSKKVKETFQLSDDQEQAFRSSVT